VSVQLVSKISNVCDPDPPTLQTDRQTDRQTDGRTDGWTDVRHAISIPRYALVHRAVKMSLENTLRTTHTSAIGAITSHKYHADHSDYLTAHFEIFAPRRNFSGVAKNRFAPADFIATNSAERDTCFSPGAVFQGRFHFATSVQSVCSSQRAYKYSTLLLISLWQ